MVYERDYAKYYDLFNTGKDYDIEVDFLERVFEKFGKKPLKILDLGCGTGMHDKMLAQRGYQVTGVDLSEEMIGLAKQNVPSGNFNVGDISNFQLEEKYDVIICMFSVLGYLTENKQLEGFFRSCKNHLNEEGLLILDVWNGLGVMRELPSSREKIVEVDGLKIVRTSYPKLDVQKHINHVRFNVRIFENENLVDEKNENHSVRFFFPQELKKYMNDAGFNLLHSCPSFQIDKKLEFDWNMVLICKNS